jgi:hypothetical protein
MRTSYYRKLGTLSVEVARGVPNIVAADWRKRFVKEAVENWPGLSEELNREHRLFFSERAKED